MDNQLKDPTEHLQRALATEDAVEAAEMLHQLHKHIVAGGPLPSHWRMYPAAVGELLGCAANALPRLANGLRCKARLEETMRKVEGE